MSRVAGKNGLYQRRRSGGQCVQCGADAGGKSKCTSCAAKNETIRQRRRAKRKAIGVCTECGQPTKEGCVLCQSCIDKCSKAGMERYYRNKAAGVCPYCGDELTDGCMCEACKAAHHKLAHEHYRRRVDAGRCQRCGGPSRPDRILCSDCAVQRKALDDLRYARYRDEVFKAYGGPRCTRCGETDQDVLQIDHIDGGGTQHLKQVGQNIYAWLHKQGFPPGFQVLCANCNVKKYRMEARAGRKTLVK